MKKKAYLIPETTVMVMETRQIIAYSGGGDGGDDPQVDPTEDNSDPDDPSNDGRSRKTYNCWDDDEKKEDW